MKFWPFNISKGTLEEKGFFKGFVDYHSHLLPGVDDGSPDAERSLAILHRYEELGVKEVWLTPHIMEDVPNTPDSLRSRFSEFQKTYTGPIVLHLGAENMLDSLFDERLWQGNLLPLEIDGKSFLLVETSYFTAPMNFKSKIEHVKAKGLYPLLAHPERYVYMEKKDYRELKDMGVAFQLNVGSITGLYGEKVQKKAKMLQKAGMYDFSGCDLHRLSMLERILAGSI